MEPGMDRVKIGDRAVGMGEPCFVVAEAGSNHDGKLAQAKNLVEVAAAAGCDAVKFQTFKADRIVAKVGDRPKYLDAITSPDESMHDIFSKLELPYEWHEDLRDHARAHGILFFSTPFDETSADLLDSIGVPCFKIASFELNHLPLVEHVARKMKPMIISTGMADLSDIEDALAVIHPHHRQVVLLHCTSSYPAPIEHANLRAIQTMREAFDVPVGYSDHTPGWTAAVAAVADGFSPSWTFLEGQPSDRRCSPSFGARTASSRSSSVKSRAAKPVVTSAPTRRSHGTTCDRQPL